MTSVRVSGHELRSEGKLEFFRNSSRRVERASSYAEVGCRLRAACSCGELSPDDVTSANQAKRWHRTHKADVLSAAAGVTL